MGGHAGRIAVETAAGKLGIACGAGGAKIAPAMFPRAFLMLLCFAVSLFAEDAKPNIVFILCDDLGANDLSCYGRKDQPTPNLDRLAGQGMRFTCAYCASPICSA